MEIDAQGHEADAGWTYRIVFALGVGLLAALVAGGLVQALREDASVPHGALAYVRLAKRAAEAGDLDRALAEYRSAFRLNPEDVGAGLGQVDVLLELGRRDEAEQALRDVARRTGNSSAGLRLGRMLVRDRRYDEAEEILARLLVLDPAQLEARLLLGDLRAQRADYAGAIEQFEDVLARDPSATAVRGRILEARRRLDAETTR